MAFPNEITLSGTLCNVEMKQAKGGSFYTTGGLKVYQGKDKEPAWFDVVAFNNERNSLADFVADSFGAGVSSLPVILRGKLEQNVWEKEDGSKVKQNKVIIDEVAVSMVFGPVGMRDEKSMIPERQVESPNVPIPDAKEESDYSTKDNDIPF